ncbi:Trans-aconitate 3-methyltransferase [Fusarium oxysporum f. sp. albedinis]|nr:Trans-aconitate 3-methyltransferase [Fusarium oxysporum f. sp. albedinis]
MSNIIDFIDTYPATQAISIHQHRFAMTVKSLSSSSSSKLAKYRASSGLLTAYQRYRNGLGSDSIQKLTRSVDK